MIDEIRNLISSSTPIPIRITLPLNPTAPDLLLSAVPAVGLGANLDPGVIIGVGKDEDVVEWIVPVVNV